MKSHIEIHFVVFRFAGQYRIASNLEPDQHEVFPTKETACLAARERLLALGGDPNAVIDLTNVEDSELGAYLR